MTIEGTETIWISIKNAISDLERMEEVPAEHVKVKGSPGFKFYVHADWHHSDLWAFTEKSTGQAIVRKRRSREEAIKDGRAVLREKGLDALKEKVKEA